MIVIIAITYFILLLAISHLTARKGNNALFFTGNRQSPWYLVAFGMIGASISGITFVSVPGMVLHSNMTYLQTCMGFILGYVAVAYVLLPVYYRLQLTTIYSVLKSMGRSAYKTGATFFIISKMTGAAARFYVPCYIISTVTDIPVLYVAIAMVVLIWLYTRTGGIRTLVWTDTLQTICMFAALILIICSVSEALGMSLTEAFTAVLHNEHSQVFVLDDWSSSRHFAKSFLSGIFIVIVMTGLDQDMMQKNLTCRSLKDAQKDMCTYGLAFLPANMLFLCLGVMLTMLCQQKGMMLPENPDELLTMFAATGALGTATLVLFSLGIVAAAFSSADSALTALTTSCCVDIIEKPDNEGIRHRVHIVVAGVFVGCIMLFHHFNSTSLIDAIYIMCSYTYGPLLGLFAYCLIHRHSLANIPAEAKVRGGIMRMIAVPAVCILSPIICYVLSIVVPELTGYHFGYELLMLNGLLTYCGITVCRLH